MLLKVTLNKGYQFGACEEVHVQLFPGCSDNLLYLGYETIFRRKHLVDGSTDALDVKLVKDSIALMTLG